MVATTLPSVLLSGTNAARPAANAVAKGTLYAETDTKQTYQSDGSAWNAWGAPAGSGVASGCKAYNSNVQNVATNTALTFDSEEFDTDAYHSTASNTSRFVVPATGNYGFMAGGFANSSPGGGPLSFKKNGTTYIRGSGTSMPSAAGYNIVHGAAALTAGDYIEVIYGGTNTINFGHASALDAQAFAMIWRIS